MGECLNETVGQGVPNHCVSVLVQVLLNEPTGSVHQLIFMHSLCMAYTSASKEMDLAGVI